MAASTRAAESATLATPMTTAGSREVLFVCHGFPPEWHSGVFRSSAFATNLPRYGFRPLVLTASDRRAGPISYGRFACESLASQVIIRCQWFRRKPFLLRAFDRLAVLSSLSRLLTRRAVGARVAQAFMRATSDAQPRLVYASSPPVEALYVGQSLAARLGLPFVADLRDPWSHAHNNRYRSALDHWLDRLEERHLLTKASLVVANTEGQKQILVSKIGIPAARVQVITNGSNPWSPSAAQRRGPFFETGKFNIAHIGVTAAEPASLRNASSAIRCDETTRSLRVVRDALQMLFERRPELREAIRLHVIGEPDGPKFSYLAALRGCISYHGPVSQNEARAAMSQADLLILLQIECDISGVSGNPIVPGKLFDYLQSGSTILAPIQDGDAATIARGFAGVAVVPPRGTAAISRHIEAQFDDWRRRGRSEKHARDLRPFDRSRLTGELAAHFARLLLDGGADRGHAAAAPPVRDSLTAGIRPRAR